MNHYTRITKQERYAIELGIRTRKSMREIAKKIDRAPKTVAAEVKRNGGCLRYYANQADFEKAKPNKLGYSKINTIPLLGAYIREKLIERWSPEVIAGRWNMENEKARISHESIYAWVYNQPDDLYLQLPRRKKKRGKKPQRSKSNIPNRISIHKRPEHINNRSEAGHYEADLVFQQGNGSQNILSVVERKSRKIMLIKNDSKHTNVVIGALKKACAKSEYSIDSITFDNGSEFTDHSELGVDTYFCDPGSPWQKGAIEHVNGIVRRYIDYRIDPKNIDQKMLNSVADLINNKPRRKLNFYTPNEMAARLYREKLETVTIYS